MTNVFERLRSVNVLFVAGYPPASYIVTSSNWHIFTLINSFLLHHFVQPFEQNEKEHRGGEQ
jgi:hypothetical protein